MRALILLLTVAACGGDNTPATADAAPLADADGSKPIVVMTTSLGDLVIELEDQEMPITTANFLSYVDDGWYDGTLVHRVEDDWVIQGGGYTTGLVDKTADPPINLETSANVSHVHGAISMARTNDPNSADSQWFIVDAPATGTPPAPGQLDGQYAAFGHVIEGLDVLAAITQVSVGAVGALDNVPDTEIVVTAAVRR